MPTRAEVKAIIKPRLSTQWVDSITWPDVVTAFGNSTAEDRTEVVEAIVSRDNKRLGAVFTKVIGRWADDSADTEADAILVDDSFTYDELQRVFGDIF